MGTIGDMASLSDSAVVLMRLDYSETSQILVFFAREHGKVRAIGKGIKRGTRTRFAVGLDLLDVGWITFTGRLDGPALATLTEWKPTRSFSGLRERLDRLQGAEYIAEITGNLTEDRDPHPSLFDALLKTLEAVSQSPEPLREVVNYQLSLLHEIGLLPRLDACVACGRETDLTHFSSHQGGAICRHCEPGRIEKRQVSTRTLRHLAESVQRIAGSPRNEAEEGGAAGGSPVETAAPRIRRDAAFALLNYHIGHIIGRDPRLASKLVSPERQRRVE
jgi:DNA repair protein RecO (recombination protein O)